jgi:2-hydroxychromene-2-carboxylate isomerase
MLFAKRHGVFRGYHDRVFERFWQRELDLESPQALAAILQECGAPSAECGAPSAECGAPSAEFLSFLDGEGRRELAQIRSVAEAAGVFGVPSFLFPDGELYWGREHLPQVRERLRAG